MKYFINSILIVSFAMHGIIMAQENLPAQTINPLEIQRTFRKDIQGYTPEEIDAAKKFLQETLYPERNKLTEKIKQLEEKKLQATDKGYLWNGAKEELKDQYYSAYVELRVEKVVLKELNEQIKNQEIIAGLRSNDLVRTLRYFL